MYSWACITPLPSRRVGSAAAQRGREEAALVLELADEALERRELRPEVRLDAIDGALAEVDLLLERADAVVERGGVGGERDGRAGRRLEQCDEIVRHALHVAVP